MRALAALGFFIASVAAAEAPFSFAVLGDAPYHSVEAFALARLLDGMAQERVAFVVHVGDIKASFEPCSDELLKSRRALLDASPVPLVYVPGDNEWADCHRGSAGGYDPEERLNELRRLFFGTSESLGRRTLRFTRQAEGARFQAFSENLRWLAGNLVFVTLNVPGSNNNLGRSKRMDVEHADRMAANFAWLAEAVARARKRDVRGLVVFAHGEPRFGSSGGKRDGFTAYRAALRDHAQALGKPMLLVHGDGHRFRIDQPLRSARTRERLANFTRLEVYGSPIVHWVRIDVGVEDAPFFSIAPGGNGPP